MIIHSDTQPNKSSEETGDVSEKSLVSWFNDALAVGDRASSEVELFVFVPLRHP